ncbi:MAG TPA: IclR family transcriptional regulator [Gemmatimonadaceae bacterium]|nr:IclR family transcriptional regulator [Gemmatimonadaceae bacterium]
MKRRSTTAGAPPVSGTQAVRRAVTLLRAFTDASPEWGLSELARDVGLHKTTVFRLLATLELDGMVARNPATGDWRLGPDAIALGARAIRANDLRAIARRELVRLADATGETATLEVLIDDDVVILDEVHGRSLINVAHSVGTRWPAHATSTGKVLLAAREADDETAGVRRPRLRLARATSRTITSPGALAAELARVRKRGYAVAQEELEAGFVAVGAPVRNHEGRAVAAISVGGPAARMGRDRIRELAGVVRAGADRISHALGSDTAAGESSAAAPAPPRRARRERAARRANAARRR